MIERRFMVSTKERDSDYDYDVEIWDYNKHLDPSEVVDLMNELHDENKRLKQINKGQELEIVRLHNLADAMSSVLRELGIYDVYDDETIEEIKNKVKGDAE